VCLLAIAWHAHPRYPLVVSANRDEYYARPTRALAWWEDAPILAGRDLQAGGTWLGISRGGRFAALTNLREPVQPRARSRGELVSGFLRSTQAALDWAETTRREAQEYAGFNLILGDGEKLVYLGNREDGPRRLEPGVHALGNALPGVRWPKIEHAREQLEQALANGDLDTGTLLALLSSRRTTAAHLLPDSGLDAEQAALLSAPFIVSDLYGTRAATALVVGGDGEVRMAEQGYERGEARERREFSFRLSG
jgi:uncharacterized protein with NRDE domain